jgi:ATP/maltotriose-dependent transcriptional regulator MalT
MNKGLIMKDILTERELSVIKYVAKGFVNSEIAEQLHISVHTVKAHLEAIYDKFGVKNRVQATVKAALLGLIDLNILL